MCKIRPIRNRSIIQNKSTILPIHSSDPSEYFPSSTICRIANLKEVWSRKLHRGDIKTIQCKCRCKSCNFFINQTCKECPKRGLLRTCRIRCLSRCCCLVFRNRLRCRNLNNIYCRSSRVRWSRLGWSDSFWSWSLSWSWVWRNNRSSINRRI